MCLVMLGLLYAVYFAYAIHYDSVNNPTLLICTCLVIAYLILKIIWRKYGMQICESVNRVKEKRNYIKFSKLTGR